jgi:hypothetical protein
MNDPFNFTNLKSAPGARRKRPWFRMAGLAGTILGAVAGFHYAACFLAMSGLALPDGQPVQQSFGQEFLSFLRIIGFGAGLGAALCLAVAAFGIAIGKVISADRNHKSTGLWLAKLAVICVLLLAFAAMISTVMSRSFR